MTQVKALLAILLGLLFLVTLTGCLTESGSNGESKFSFEYILEVLQIKPPVDANAGTIILRDFGYVCNESNVAVLDTVDDSLNYEMSSGSLRLWEKGDCLAVKLSGSSSTIIGAWTGTSMAPTDSVPVAYRNSCQDGFEQVDPGAYKKTSVRYDISQTSLKRKVSGQVCFAESQTSLYSENELFKVTASSCNKITVRNIEENKTATITSVYSNDSVSLTFSYGQAVCALKTTLGLVKTPPTCSGSLVNEYEGYFACTQASGFYGEMMKPSAKALAIRSLSALKFP